MTASSSSSGHSLQVRIIIQRVRLTLAKDGYIPGACNYHLCRCLDWPKQDLPDERTIHIEYTPRWTRR